MMASIESPLVETTTTGDSGLAESLWFRAAWRRRARLAGRVAPGIVKNVSLGNKTGVAAQDFNVLDKDSVDLKVLARMCQ